MWPQLQSWMFYGYIQEIAKSTNDVLCLIWFSIGVDKTVFSQIKSDGFVKGQVWDIKIIPRYWIYLLCVLQVYYFMNLKSYNPWLLRHSKTKARVMFVCLLVHMYCRYIIPWIWSHTTHGNHIILKQRPV